MGFRCDVFHRALWGCHSVFTRFIGLFKGVCRLDSTLHNKLIITTCRQSFTELHNFYGYMVLLAVVTAYRNVLLMGLVLGLLLSAKKTITTRTSTVIAMVLLMIKKYG